MSNESRCTLRGTLRGLICPRLSVYDLIAGAEVVAVASVEKKASVVGPLTIEDAPGLKSVIRRLEPRELDRTVGERRPLLRGATSADGTFCLLEPAYRGGLLDLYAVVTAVPFEEQKGRQVQLREPYVLFLGTYEPGVDGTLDLVIPQAVWCRIKRLADVWTVAGKVVLCADRSRSIAGLAVAAYDVDWLQDDHLGTAVTSNAGIFRIDYLGETYRKGTFIDVELFGGPDVYFKITDGDGNVLLGEEPAKGRTPGRANAGPCLCVDLCIDLPVPASNVTLWTSVGGSFTIPDASGLNGFDADGFAGSAKYGITSTIHLTGQTARATEYRFRVSGVTTPNGGAPPADGAFSRIVGKSPGDGLFVPFHLGDYWRFDPFKILPVFAKLTDVDPVEGWLSVEHAIARTFAENLAFDPATFDVYVPTGRLLLLDTTGLTSQPSVPAVDAGPGAAIPPGDKISIEKVAIRFEARDATTHAALPGSGTTLNSMVVNNNPVFLELAMKEHLEGTPCDILHGSIHVAYTAYHPLLQSMRLNVRSNSGAYDLDLSDPPHLPLSGNTDAAIQGQNDPALEVPNNSSTPLFKCTYLVKFWAVPRLFSSSESSEGVFSADVVGEAEAETTFFYEP